MTGADWLILLILLGSTLIGLLRASFVRRCRWRFDRGHLGRLEIRTVVEPHLGGLLADPSIAPWVGRLVILVLVLLVGWVVGLLLSYFTRSVGWAYSIG